MRDFGLTEEQRQIRRAIGTLAREKFAPGAAAADRHYKPPMANLQVLVDHGYVGMFLPEALGGAGLGLMETVLVVEEIARYCANTAMLFMCMAGATPRALLTLGTDEQRQRYLPRLLRGEMLTAWSMSEPNAGSDVGNLQTKAVRDGEHYIVNGSKLWCSGARVSDLFLVLVRLEPVPGMRGVGAIFVERGTPGFSIGRHLDMLGLRATGMAELVFQDCRIPAENVLVQAGRMRELLRVLDSDRIVGNPPLCLGVAEAALASVTQHLRDRSQFGRPLAEFQGLQWKLADMAIDIEAARALLYRAAARADQGDMRSVDASITKTYVNQMSVRVTNEAMQMAGAYGLSEEYPYERYFRDVRGMSVGYGTTEIHRGMIARELINGNYSF